MKKALASLLFALTLSAPAAAGGFGVVWNANDDGRGSLRQALDSANTIVILPWVGTIPASSTLIYDGHAPLTIIGTRQTVDGANLENNLSPVLEVSQGADVYISKLTLDAGGGNENGPYNRLNPGGGKGLFVDVPLDRTGNVKVTLRDFTVRGTGNHGVHISDCTLDDDCGGGSGGGGDGSSAGVEVYLTRVTIEDSGNGKQDADGFRVDDRGPGDIYFYARRSVFFDNGADGVELDEGNEGDVIFNVARSRFEFNGEYCVVGEFVPGDDCDDDGEPDVDDAFDIDEAGPGGLYGTGRNLIIVDNFDEGLDFDEEDGDGIDIVLANIFGEGNEDETVKTSEEGEGDNIVRIRNITDDGDLEFEEEDGGIVGVTLIDSFVGDDLQIEADDGDPDTTDGFYRGVNTTVADELQFEGEIDIL
ncbi:MAG: hypothetical protein AAFS02_06730 [Pseudomonadota bacterium]